MAHQAAWLETKKIMFISRMWNRFLSKSCEIEWHCVATRHEILSNIVKIEGYIIIIQYCCT